MFLPGDFVSEVIAHFIGYFHIQVEDARVHFDYPAFYHSATPTDVPSLHTSPLPFSQSFQATSYIPDVQYSPESFAVKTLQPDAPHGQAMQSHVAEHSGGHAVPVSIFGAGFRFHASDVPSEGTPPVPEPQILPAQGSVVFLVEQDRLLQDDDVIVTGSPGLGADNLPTPLPLDGLKALVAHASLVQTPFVHENPFSSSDDISQFVARVEMQARMANPQSATPADAGDTGAGAAPVAVSHAEAGSSGFGGTTHIHTVTGNSVSNGIAGAQTGAPSAASQTIEAPAPEPRVASINAGDGASESTPPAQASPPDAEAHIAPHSPTPADAGDGSSPTASQTIQTTDTFSGPIIDGTYVNGGETAAAPDLADYLPDDIGAAVASPVPSPAETASLAGAVSQPASHTGAASPTDTALPVNASSTGSSSSTVPDTSPRTASVVSHPAEDGAVATTDVNAGGNLLANEAHVVDAGATSTFLGVAGDYHRLDAITQTNAYSDDDHIDSVFTSRNGNAQTTAAVNSATFEHEVRDTAADVQAAADHSFMPSNWSVSSVLGDLIFTNWVNQYSFTSDNDTHVLTATGNHTTITTGENLGLDNVSFSSIGSYYDLILVSGNYFDANVINQTNVLFDNDRLEASSGVTAGSATASTSGNLLWNDARIVNVGAIDLQHGLPASYTAAMQATADGDLRMPQALQNDGSFEGFGNLRVLFVGGSLYDLNYINQVNVLGDNDRVAIYHDAVIEQQPETVWDISTGSNALINSASIVDYDSVGTGSYYGGQLYSDAILIQADIVQGPDGQAPLDSQTLASEVIAFLGDDVAATTQTHDHAPMPVHVDSPSVDVMHSMFA